MENIQHVCQSLASLLLYSFGIHTALIWCIFKFTVMSRVMRKPTFCICENKDADQLRGKYITCLSKPCISPSLLIWYTHSTHLMYLQIYCNEPRHEKTNVLHMQKQRRRSASRLLRSNREADQRLCFRYLDSTIPLLPKSKISSL